MMRHAVPSQGSRIGLIQSPPDAALDRKDTGLNTRRFPLRAVAEHDLPKTLHLIVFDRMRAVGVGLSQGRFGVEHQAPRRGLLFDLDSNLWPMSVTVQAVQKAYKMSCP